MTSSVLIQTFFSGLAIIGASFLLSWAGEASQLFLSRTLSVAFIAMVTTFPEYAVDFYIAGKAGHSPSYLPYVAANMTGSNRLLLGVSWGLVAVFWWIRTKKTSFPIGKEHSLEFSCLWLVILYSFWIPYKRTLSLWDGIFLLGFYFFYIYRASQGTVEEPELEGPASAIVRLPLKIRKIVVFSLFLFSFGIIAAAAKPFTEGLIAAGKMFHVEQFLFIQFLAPLASELPEFIVAGWLAYRGNPSLAMATLLSSKLNQWTFLLGSIPVVYFFSSLTAGHPSLALPLDARQGKELFLTAAQAFFSLTLLSRFRLRLPEAFLLFLLYASQYLLFSIAFRFHFALIYLAGGILMMCLSKTRREAIREQLEFLWKKISIMK